MLCCRDERSVPEKHAYPQQPPQAVRRARSDRVHRSAPTDCRPMSAPSLTDAAEGKQAGPAARVAMHACMHAARCTHSACLVCRLHAVVLRLLRCCDAARTHATSIAQTGTVRRTPLLRVAMQHVLGEVGRCAIRRRGEEDRMEELGPAVHDRRSEQAPKRVAHNLHRPELQEKGGTCVRAARTHAPRINAGSHAHASAPARERMHPCTCSVKAMHLRMQPLDLPFQLHRLLQRVSSPVVVEHDDAPSEADVSEKEEGAVNLLDRYAEQRQVVHDPRGLQRIAGWRMLVRLQGKCQ